uniref:Uncharacterized protein n=1 Tax=Panagrolaimus superbus TaxID=310955 RepID=A0A914Y5E9_9BILA
MELIKNELFLTLPPSYQKAVEKVEQEFRDIPETDHRAKRDILLEFSLKYLMIKELWDIYFFERFEFSNDCGFYASY